MLAALLRYAGDSVAHTHDAVTNARGGAQVTYLSHQQRARPMVADSSERAAYYRIAEHYRFVLRTLFDCFRYPRVIILEVDLLSYVLQINASVYVPP